MSSSAQSAGVGRKLMEAVIERGKQTRKGNIRLVFDLNETIYQYNGQSLSHVSDTKGEKRLLSGAFF